MAADPAFIIEASKAASYIIALSVVAVWNEKKRTKGSATHARDLDARFIALDVALSDHRNELNADMSELKVSIKGISSVVGVDSSNGLRGTLGEMREDIKELQTDVTTLKVDVARLQK